MTEEVKKTKNGKQGYSYWKWMPGKRTDSWKPLKKCGRPRGYSDPIKKEEMAMDLGKVVNWITFWKKQLTHPDNIREVEAWKPLTIEQACKEVGIHKNTFFNRLKTHPELKLRYDELRESRRDYLRDLAEGNLERGLAGGLWLNWKELVDASFKILEKTDKAYQPKVEIEQKSININLDKSTDDILSEIWSLLW